MPGTAIQRLVRQSPQKMRLVADLIRGKDVNEAYATYFPDAPPARSTIGVAALPLGAHVEIDAVLALPD